MASLSLGRTKRINRSYESYERAVGGRNRRVSGVLPPRKDGRPRFGACRFSQSRLSQSAACLQSGFRCLGDCNDSQKAGGIGSTSSSRNDPANRRDRAESWFRRPPDVLSSDPTRVCVLAGHAAERWPKSPLDRTRQEAYPAGDKQT